MVFDLESSMRDVLDVEPDRVHWFQLLPGSDQRTVDTGLEVTETVFAGGQ